MGCFRKNCREILVRYSHPERKDQPGKITDGAAEKEDYRHRQEVDERDDRSEQKIFKVVLEIHNYREKLSMTERAAVDRLFNTYPLNLHVGIKRF
jgi:hypothetical protein